MNNCSYEQLNQKAGEYQEFLDLAVRLLPNEENIPEALLNKRQGGKP